MSVMMLIMNISSCAISAATTPSRMDSNPIQTVRWLIRVDLRSTCASSIVASSPGAIGTAPGLPDVMTDAVGFAGVRFAIPNSRFPAGARYRPGKESISVLCNGAGQTADRYWRCPHPVWADIGGAAQPSIIVRVVRHSHAPLHCAALECWIVFKINADHTMEAERQNHISACIDDYQERQAAL